MKTILIIDDDPTMRLLSRSTLEDSYRIFEAEGGAQALGLLGRIAPDLIILDVLMPGSDATAICDVIKESPATSKVPILILTAIPEQPNVPWRKFLKAEAYMTKPFEPEALREKVHAMLADAPKIMKTILIVDDDSTMRFLARSTLEGSYKIFEAEGSDPALAFLKNMIPDLILLDILMPGSDGTALCDKIKQDAVLSKVPVLILTAMKDEAYRLWSRFVGADAYMVKPFEPSQLLTKVRAMLAEKETAREPDSGR